MKILAVNHSDIIGGAARAAYRLSQALRQSSIDVRMLVHHKRSDDPTVIAPVSRISKAINLARPAIGQTLGRVLHSTEPGLLSPAVVPSGIANLINSSNADIAHLHWLGDEMMTVEAIARIRKPVVWTLHDMWAFCGAEHYTETNRWRDGYSRQNRPETESGFDLNRWVWNRKRRAWKRPITIVAPSRWLAACARESALMKDWRIEVIANAIDTEVWAPMDRTAARRLLGLPDLDKVKLVVFGAIGGQADPRKGFELLSSSLKRIRPGTQNLHLAVFGQSAPVNPVDLGFPVHWMGHLGDDISLRMLYNAADAVLIPSRQDNLPNMGVEALSCGTPVVAFNTGGLSDIVEHQKTGWLASPFDCDEFARGIEWVLYENTKPCQLRSDSRNRAVDRFSFPVVSTQYQRVFEDVRRG